MSSADLIKATFLSCAPFVAASVKAAYCHFGREPVTKNGIKFFEWENAKDLSKYKTMNSSEVEAFGVES